MDDEKGSWAKQRIVTCPYLGCIRPCISCTPSKGTCVTITHVHVRINAILVTCTAVCIAVCKLTYTCTCNSYMYVYVDVDVVHVLVQSLAVRCRYMNQIMYACKKVAYVHVHVACV